jgi:hypothetical protein
LWWTLATTNRFEDIQMNGRKIVEGNIEDIANGNRKP